jgi:hypothetical protein
VLSGMAHGHDVIGLRPKTPRYLAAGQRAAGDRGMSRRPTTLQVPASRYAHASRRHRIERHGGGTARNEPHPDGLVCMVPDTMPRHCAPLEAGDKMERGSFLGDGGNFLTRCRESGAASQSRGDILADLTAPLDPREAPGDRLSPRAAYLGRRRQLAGRVGRPGRPAGGRSSAKSPSQRLNADHRHRIDQSCGQENAPLDQVVQKAERGTGPARRPNQRRLARLLCGWKRRAGTIGSTPITSLG